MLVARALISSISTITNLSSSLITVMVTSAIEAVALRARDAESSESEAGCCSSITATTADAGTDPAYKNNFPTEQIMAAKVVPS